MRIGLSQEGLCHYCRDPDGMLRGLWGDIHHAPDSHKKTILVYYIDGIVAAVMVDDRNDTE